DVAEAFRLRMTLDDVPAPDDAARHRTLTRIIELCQAADARLDAESEAFDRLRDLEGRAVEVAAELDRRRTTIEAALPAAEGTAADLAARYSGGAVTAIATNAEQVRERLAYAVAALAEARNAPAPPAAALAVRGAEQAVDQAEHLLQAIEKAAADLPAARATADALIAEVTGDLAAGRAALAGSAVPPGLGAAVAAGEQALSEVQTALAAGRPDPLDAVARLEAADAALDSALAAARDAAERTARAQSLLAQALPVARAEVAAANDFITTRRGAVDSGARVYLSEAQRHLALAESLAMSDPAAALTEAQQARQLAASGGQAARADVQGWGGGYGQRGGFDSGAFAGAVLGGLLSGGRSQGGFGGSGSRSRRSSGGGGGRRGGGGRF
ncbi:MAG: TPM domain-containing protein, partial [Actinoplanes sp.]